MAISVMPKMCSALPMAIINGAFSALLFYIFSGVNATWFALTYGIRVHMNGKSGLCEKGRWLGKYRVATDIVKAIKNDLGNDICAYLDRELELAWRE